MSYVETGLKWDQNCEMGLKWDRRDAIALPRTQNTSSEMPKGGVRDLVHVGLSGEAAGFA